MGPHWYPSQKLADTLRRPSPSGCVAAGRAQTRALASEAPIPAIAPAPALERSPRPVPVLGILRDEFGSVLPPVDVEVRVLLARPLQGIDAIGEDANPLALLSDAPLLRFRPSVQTDHERFQRADVIWKPTVPSRTSSSI